MFNAGRRAAEKAAKLSAEARIERAKGQIAEQERELEALRDEVQNLNLLCQAMWTLLSDKLGVSDAALQAKLEELQAAQAKAAEAPVELVTCPACQRTYHPRRDRCLYCGAPRPKDSPFA